MFIGWPRNKCQSWQTVFHYFRRNFCGGPFTSGLQRLDSSCIEVLIVTFKHALNGRYWPDTHSHPNVFSCLKTENSQVVPIQENMSDDQPIQSRSCSWQPLLPLGCVQEHCEVGLLSPVFQDVLAWWPSIAASCELSWYTSIDGVVFPMVVNEHNAVSIPEDGCHHLSRRWHHFGLLWSGRKRIFTLLVLSLGPWLKVVSPSLIVGWGNIQENQLISFKKY